MRISDVRRADLDGLHASMGAMPGARQIAPCRLFPRSGIGRPSATRKFEENPARGIERNPEKAKERFLSTVELKGG